MKKFISMLIAAAITLTVFPAATSANTSQLTGTISIGGSTSLYPVMATMATEFQKLHPKVQINFNNTGINNGRNDANRNAVSFGMVSAKWTDENAEQFPNVIPVQICYDSVAVIVNRSNPVNNLTTQQLKNIYGIEPQVTRITNWNGVSGFDRTITTISRESGSGIRDCFQSVLGLSGSYDRAVNSTVEGSTGTVIQKVMNNADAIGYVSVASADKTVKVLTLDGITPTTVNIQTGRYPIQRPFSLLINKYRKLNSAEQEFLRFIYSAAGESIIKEMGLIPMTFPATTAELAKVNLAAQYNIADAMAVLKHLARIQTLTGRQVEMYDFFDTGEIKIGNAMEILKYLARMDSLIIR